MHLLTKKEQKETSLRVFVQKEKENIEIAYEKAA